MSTYTPFKSRLALLLVLVLVLAFALPINAQDTDNGFTGRIAFTGTDGNIYTLEDFAAEPVALTTDAQRGERRYTWPTWATDGRLAFFAEELTFVEEQLTPVLKVFITPPNETASAQAYESATESFTYAYWAPANCPDSGTNCRDLAVLTSSATGLSVLRIRDEAPTFSAKTIGTGGPFYYSYSPDASRMLWQRFSQQLDIYDTTGDEVLARLPDTAGFFQAPMWSPVDNRLLFSVLNTAGNHDLVIAEGEERLPIATDQEDVLWFTWSPDGSNVAYKLAMGPITVVNAATGTPVARSSQSDVLAFFWSPDGQKIAYLTPGRADDAQQAALMPISKQAAPAQQADLPRFSWHVLDIATNQDWMHFSAFIPTRTMLYLVSYFDQFAQSHRLWSPDSRYLVYAGLTPEGGPQLHTLDTANPAAPVRTLARATMGIWSYE